MTFDVNREYNQTRQELFDIIFNNSCLESLTNWVTKKNNSGLNKRQIYDILLLLHSDILKEPDPNDKIYDWLSDFLDRFTDFASGPSSRILPNEPNV